MTAKIKERFSVKVSFEQTKKGNAGKWALLAEEAEVSLRRRAAESAAKQANPARQRFEQAME